MEVGLLAQRRKGAKKKHNFKSLLCASAPLRERSFLNCMQNEDTLNPSTLALWEIVSVLVSCLIAEWVVLAFVGPSKVALAIPIALALLLMIFSHSVYGETLHDIGFRTDNFIAAAKLLLVPTVAAIALIVLVSVLTSGDFQPARPFRSRVAAVGDA